jgi:hypothetical protein
MKSNQPPFRKLRGYAFDPLLSLQSDTADINSIVYRVAWEELGSNGTSASGSDAGLREGQGVGPVGEYLEVIDYDPTVGKFYAPVDLNDPYLLAQDGLAPSESNPQFHQQMVYAVAMTTIQNFERALGRKILWAPRLLADKVKYQEYVQRLRIYPHATREPNAYYSPQKKALLFGYFSAAPANAAKQMPGSLVFTCLSHDIIAHETTHAILDGMHRYYNEPSNPDVLAFHEAFADIVALFQHFTFPEVLKRQIAETKGNLESQNLLGKLAQEFGTAIGSYGSLRDAIGHEVNGKWEPKAPKVEDYLKVTEPHARGSILVAAIFEAFINIYKNRAADLLRIASNGSGILPEGELHPDLVNRLAGEAAKAAGHVLNMCVRALDYCPPVDLTFGEYLRAIITADSDLVSDDGRGYRLIFIEAFRRRGIYPQGIKTLSVESLQYTLEPAAKSEHTQLFRELAKFLREYRDEIMYERDRAEIARISSKYMGGTIDADVPSLHKRISLKLDGSAAFEELTGLVFGQDWVRLGIRTSIAYKGDDPDKPTSGPSFAINNLRWVSRVGPDGNQINYIIFSLVQRAGGVVKEGKFTQECYQPDDNKDAPPGGLQIRGGCTMIFDLETRKLRYAIAKPLLDLAALKRTPTIRQLHAARIEKQAAYQNDGDLMAATDYSKYFGQGLNSAMNEPFALLHHH